MCFRFHNRKIFKSEYAPQLFSFAVRRPGNAPSGVISIDEDKGDGGVVQPILTTGTLSFHLSLPCLTSVLLCRSFTLILMLVSKKQIADPISFSISAATTVRFTGTSYVHAWMSQQFETTMPSTLTLTARARQFSWYVLRPWSRPTPLVLSCACLPLSCTSTRHRPLHCLLIFGF